jgi:1-acyl-sn-glycerol-3-phosphate acyltransferase
MNKSTSSSPDAEPTRHSGAQLNANLLWRLLKIPVWIFFQTWIRLSAADRQHIDNSCGGLFLINHQSFLDPMVVALLLRRPVSFLARDSLFRIPVLSFILRRTYVTPISREAVRGGSIRAAVERLDAGFIVGIFPEGTRSSGNDVKRFRGGFLALARRTNLPIYPVGVAGTDHALPRGSWFIRPCRVQVVYGEPFTATEVAEFQEGTDTKDLAEIARKRVAECQRAAAALLHD